MAVPPAVDAVFEFAGPFVIPVVLFVLGMVGYGVLVALGRLELVDDDRDRPGRESDADADGDPPAADDEV